MRTKGVAAFKLGKLINLMSNNTMRIIIMENYVCGVSLSYH